MLSVLPASREDLPWASQCLGKRPLPPSCLGEYQSGASRAKRLRQELLRLREWEQRAHQETAGAFEGQADSCDEAFTLEPPRLTFPVVFGQSGRIYLVEDASDATSSPVHGLASRVAPASKPSDPPLLSVISSNPPLTQQLLTPQRRALSNPTHLCFQPSSSSPFVNTPGTCSQPQQAPFPLSSAAGPSLVQASVPPRHARRGVDLEGREHCSRGGLGGDSWDQYLGASLSRNPLQDFLEDSASRGASVQPSSPAQPASVRSLGSDELDPSSAEDAHADEGEAEEENLLEEETSSKPGRETKSSDLESTDGAGGSETCEGCCAGRRSSLVLPPLPAKFLGLPTPLRLRLLEFLVHASELLGIGVQSLYLAASLLDCVLVEEGVRRGPHAPALEAAELKVSALACLCHAWACEPSKGGSRAIRRSVVGFCKALNEGGVRSPRMEAILPARPSAVEARLQALQDLLPMAVADSTLSASAWVFGSMLELRGMCTQKEHLVVFVAELCAVGFADLPAPAVLAANCCLVTGAVRCSKGQAGSGDAGEAGVSCHPHHISHFQVLQSLLCPPYEVQPAAEGAVEPLEVREPCSQLVEAEASLDLSV